MDGRKITNTLLVICIVFSMLAIASSAYAVMSIDSNQSEVYDDSLDQVKYTIFIGMGDRTDEEILPVEERMKELITDTGNGYTLEHECGGYVVDGVVMEDRVSLKFVVTNAQWDQISYIMHTIRAEFGFPAIFYQQERASSGFFTD